MLKSGLRKRAARDTFELCTYSVREVEIDECPALVYTSKWENEKVKNLFTVIYDNEIFQVFIDEKPEAMMNARRKVTRLASQIDTDKFFCGVVSGNLISSGLNQATDGESGKIFPDGVPVKYIVASIDADDRELSVEVKVDISQLVK